MDRDIVPLEMPVLVKVKEGRYLEASTGLTVVMIGNRPIYIDQMVDDTTKNRAKRMGLESSLKRRKYS